MKKLLLTLLGILLLPPSVSGYKVEIPSLEVDGVKIPRSVYTKILITPGTPAEKKTEPSLQVAGETPVPRSLYSKIQITPGTPAEEKTEPSLQVTGETPVSRSLYSKIRLDADAGTYTLVSDDPTTAPDLTYSFRAAPEISVGTHTYTIPAVSGTYTLVSADPATAPNLTYSFDAAPQVSVADHTYTTPAVSGSYTLVANNHDNYDDLAYNFDEHPRVYLATEIKDYITSVESIETDGQPLMTYHSATQTLRATRSNRREVRVINLSGQIVLTGHLGGADGTISVAALPAGVYVVIARRHGAEAPQTLKFIKQ